MATDKMITGFQYSPLNGQYIGEYQFPDNLDQDAIHLPPNTTLERPPKPMNGKVILRINDTWDYAPAEKPVNDQVPILNYSQLQPFFINHLKLNGQWSDDDQLKYDQAMEEIAKIQKNKMETPNLDPNNDNQGN